MDLTIEGDIPKQYVVAMVLGLFVSILIVLFHEIFMIICISIREILILCFWAVLLWYVVTKSGCACDMRNIYN